MRRTVDNRVIAGGEDDPFRDPVRRDARLAQKIKRLIDRLQKMFPHVEVESEYAWAGTFGETKDGLGYIGKSAEIPNAFFALGNSGQIVLIVPSARLVIVSLGFSVDPTNRPPVEAAARLTAAADVW